MKPKRISLICLDEVLPLDCDGGVRETERVANATLISAAPDPLEACQAQIKAIDAIFRECNMSAACKADALAAQHRALKAITRTEGK